MKNVDIEINSYLTFKIAEEVFAIHVDKVLHIQEVGHITKVPESPEYMLGVINQRGVVLPVIDSRLKLGLSCDEHSYLTSIIVMDLQLDDEIVGVGLLVDSVEEVLEIDQQMVKEPPKLGREFSSNIITGIVELKDELVMLMDIDELFNIKDLSGITAEMRKDMLG